ncbi:hypothetical protein PVAG01_00213 [Phlyctema vagabunda]|uniref:NAD(P)-binding protein n=1 Tax=Phlyctema vagabunda TaxID=108571 RepID=A0ABR4PTL3_9HELO
MTTHHFNVEELDILQGKTILITGAATGIGRETVIIAHRHGANVAFGDWNVELGQAFAETLSERVLFRQCDVSKFEDVLQLFQSTWERFGTIHAVIGNAGINTENFMEDEYENDVPKLKAPDLTSINVNLIGQIYTAKCALHYFKKWPEERCQLVMTGSAASFIDTPPLYLYCAGKAGILGFMRGLRTQVIKQNVTVNMVAPWMTVTPMLLPELLKIWGDLPANQPEGVAHALILPILRPELNGKAFFVAGHEIVDFEDKLQEFQHLWMGEQLSLDVNEGQRRLIP